MKRAEFLKHAGTLAVAAGIGSCAERKNEGKKPASAGTDLQIAWDEIPCPFFDRAPRAASRDPALIYHDGLFRCFFTAVEGGHFLDLAESSDLVAWSAPRRLTTSNLNFSSPGNVLRVGDRWILCVQSYPILPGEKWGSDDSRLWLMESPDLVSWSQPKPINPAGCSSEWADQPRQIDPYLVHHEGRYWCFHKTSGCLGLMVSDDLENWEDATPGRPALSHEQTPDRMSVENPCVVRDRGDFALFFAPCRDGRGIGVARSTDLKNWSDVRYLNFPELSWADGGPTAAMVIDMRKHCGRWLMAFHGERSHGPAAMGLAWSEDLENWNINI